MGDFHINPFLRHARQKHQNKNGAAEINNIYYLMSAYCVFSAANLQKILQLNSSQ